MSQIAVGRSYYEVLGVDPDASESEIKHAWRKKALQEHPDHSHRPDAEARFREVMRAKEALLSSNANKYHGSRTRSQGEYQTHHREERSKRTQTEPIDWEDLFEEYIEIAETVLNKFKSGNGLSARGSRYNLLIGYVLMFFSGVLLTTGNIMFFALSVIFLLPTQDYCGQIIRTIASDTKKTPEFSSYHSMIVRGGILLFQSVFVLPYILLSSFANTIKASSPQEDLLSLESIISAVLTVAIALYSLPAIITTLAMDTEDSLSGETVGNQIQKINTSGYPKLFVCAILALLAVLAVTAAYTPAVGAVVAFYSQTHLCKLYGEFFALAEKSESTS